MGIVNDVILFVRRMRDKTTFNDSLRVYDFVFEIFESFVKTKAVDYATDRSGDFYENKIMFYKKLMENSDYDNLIYELRNLIYEKYNPGEKNLKLTPHDISRRVNRTINFLIKDIRKIQEYETRKVEEHHKRLDEASRLKKEYINLIENDESIHEEELYIYEINDINFEEQYNNLAEYEKELMRIYYQARGIHSGHLGFIGGKKKRKSRKNKTKNKTRKTKKSRKNNKKK